MRQLEPGHLETIIQSQSFFPKTKDSQVLNKRTAPITFICGLFPERSGSFKHDKVLKGCIVKKDSFVFKKRCDWIIFFQVPRFDLSYCK